MNTQTDTESNKMITALAAYLRKLPEDQREATQGAIDGLRESVFRALHKAATAHGLPIEAVAMFAMQEVGAMILGAALAQNGTKYSDRLSEEKLDALLEGTNKHMMMAADGGYSLAMAQYLMGKSDDVQAA